MTSSPQPHIPVPRNSRQGHFEFFLCDINDLDDPDGVVTQECLNKYPLTRAPDAPGANASSPIDPDYPGRYYVDPPCRKVEVGQNVSANMPDAAYSVKMPYLLPNIECEHCVLQMHYRKFPPFPLCCCLLGCGTESPFDFGGAFFIDVLGCRLCTVLKMVSILDVFSLSRVCSRPSLALRPPERPSSVKCTSM